MMMYDVCLSDVCLLRTSGRPPPPKSRTEMPTKTKVGTRVAPRPRHTWLAHHFQGQKVKGQAHQAALLTAALTHQTAAVVTVRKYSPWEPTATLIAVCRRRCLLGGAKRFGAHRGRRGAGHIVAAGRLQIVRCTYIYLYQLIHYMMVR